MPDLMRDRVADTTWGSVRIELDPDVPCLGYQTRIEDVLARSHLNAEHVRKHRRIEWRSRPARLHGLKGKLPCPGGHPSYWVAHAERHDRWMRPRARWSSISHSSSPAASSLASRSRSPTLERARPRGGTGYNSRRPWDCRTCVLAGRANSRASPLPGLSSRIVMRSALSPLDHPRSEPELMRLGPRRLPKHVRQELSHNRS